MLQYPKILGFYPSMPYQEIENNISKRKGYNVRKRDDCLTYWRVVDSKRNPNRAMAQFFLNREEIYLEELTINYWEEFFEFTHETLSFENLIDIFKNYFLRDFTFDIIKTNDPVIPSVYFKNKLWNICFDCGVELISYTITR